VELQRLPLPVGSPHPIRRGGRQAGRRRPGPVLIGALAACAGAVIASQPPDLTVGLDPGAYRVGDVRLPARGQGVYAGPEGAVVIVRHPDATLAAASTDLHGTHMVGRCRLPSEGRTERCTFRLGSRTLRAVDELDHGGWDRRYQDGRRVRIVLAGAVPAPVPIALGR